VSVAFAPGEIHALVGENGAGKSTLMKIICGIYQADEGEVFLDGLPIRSRDYRQSLSMGIDIVHQEVQIVRENTVAESIMLDKLITYGPTGIINWRAVNKQAKVYMDMVGLDVPPNALMKGLSPAQKRLTQIARALAADARVILLDEPTSTLTLHEAQTLFGILNDLKKTGVVLVFVSHKFEEVFALCDRVTVLRDGRHVGTKPTSELGRQELIRMMIGRECKEDHLGRVNFNPDKEVLRVEGLTRHGKIEDASFSLREGEILGLYGLVGAGRTEMARVLIGEDRMDAGRVIVRGEFARIRSIADSLYRYRIGYLTENRKEEGLLLKDTVRANLTITVWPRMVNKFTRWISQRQEDQTAHEMVESLEIRTPGLAQIVENLSGGNQQKVSLAKWLAADCDVLIIDEPTVGVDVGAKEQIHRLIRRLAEVERRSIILISSDMPEIIRLANRILVFRDQRIVGQVDDVDNSDRTYDEISMAIGEFLQ
ncbi:MAG: sugar ABC transporter ATP-binding protein, partial [Phycisphaerae bacterium]|nr:sugar ABC transporter ATP-binding protein [Phycisphaerae bacterium]